MATLRDETRRFLKAWMKLRQVVQAANFNRFQSAGLSATQFMALNALPPGGTTLTQLSQTLNLSPATLNETINSLQSRGFVQRSRDPEDARRTRIAATSAGAEMRNSSSKEFHGYMSKIFSGMSATRREGLLAGLEEMVRLSESSGSEPTVRLDGDLPAKRNARRSPRR